MPAGANRFLRMNNSRAVSACGNRGNILAAKPLSHHRSVMAMASSSARRRFSGVLDVQAHDLFHPLFRPFHHDPDGKPRALVETQRDPLTLHIRNSLRRYLGIDSVYAGSGNRDPDEGSRRSICGFLRTCRTMYTAPHAASKWPRQVKGVQAEHRRHRHRPKRTSAGGFHSHCGPYSRALYGFRPRRRSATDQTIRIINAVRERRASPVSVILIPNRVDRRTLEGRQLEKELESFGEIVSQPIGYRSAFVRAFTTGQSVADNARGSFADQEIKTLCDLVVRQIKEKR